MAIGRQQNNFDLLRLLAAFSVVFSHYFRLFGIGPDPVLEFTGQFDFSEIGLVVFFVLSGYLVTKSLL